MTHRLESEAQLDALLTTGGPATFASEPVDKSVTDALPLTLDLVEFPSD